MELLIVRHGPAGNAAEKAAWKLSGTDSARPLTKDGMRRTREAAAGLARVVDCPALMPDARLEEALAWLKARREKSVALVGHEPHLSELASWLLTGAKSSILRLKKPQAMLLELKKLEPGGAQLVWSLPPRQLRALGRR